MPSFPSTPKIPMSSTNLAPDEAQGSRAVLSHAKGPELSRAPLGGAGSAQETNSGMPVAYHADAAEGQMNKEKDNVSPKIHKSATPPHHPFAMILIGCLTLTRKNGPLR